MLSAALNRTIALARVDLSPRHRVPHPAAVLGGTILSVGLCLLADALAVKAGTAVFPATRGYPHFRFGGVVIACLAWPAVVRVTRDPRWVFARLAVLVTAVLLLPDLYIWLTGQPGRAVLVLVVMHVLIALITCNVLVRVAPPRPSAPPAA